MTELIIIMVLHTVLTKTPKMEMEFKMVPICDHGDEPCSWSHLHLLVAQPDDLDFFGSLVIMWY